MINLETNKNKDILLVILLCSIAEHFYELCRILYLSSTFAECFSTLGESTGQIQKKIFETLKRST